MQVDLELGMYLVGRLRVRIRVWLEKVLNDLLADRLNTHDMLKRGQFGRHLLRSLVDFFGNDLQRPNRTHQDQRAVLHDIGDHRAAAVDDDGAGRALRHVELHGAVIGGGDAADGAADTHGGDRRADLHVAGMRDFAGDEGERALHQIKQLRILRAVRLVDEFVHHHARIGGQVERAAVIEGDAECAGDGLQHVALEDRVADMRRDGDAVTYDGGAAVNDRDAVLKGDVLQTVTGALGVT